MSDRRWWHGAKVDPWPEEFEAGSMRIGSVADGNNPRFRETRASAGESKTLERLLLRICFNFL
jgi:hypothetical protein